MKNETDLNPSKGGKVLFHIDLNSFFASCEIADNPELAGKPIAIAPESKRRGIILSASYEARKFGVKSAMRVADAIRLCPYLVIVDSNFSLYSSYSRIFFDYLYTITDFVEPASIDEGYLDVTELSKNVHPLDLAKRIQDELLTKHKLPCSIGIAPNKFLAKIASDMKKPLGITILRKREIDKYLWPLPIEAMPGVGKKTYPRLVDLGIKTIYDLAHYPKPEVLSEVIGKNNAQYLIEKAHGIDDSELDLNRFDEVLSVSNAHTFDADVHDVVHAKTGLKVLCNTVSNRLQKKGVKAHTFTIQIKYNTFKSMTRSRSVDLATNDSQVVYAIIEELFDDFYDDAFGIRLLGVAASKIIEAKDEIVQLSIFDERSFSDRENEVYELIGKLQNQFGKESIAKGIKNKKERSKTSNE